MLQPVYQLRKAQEHMLKCHKPRVAQSLSHFKTNKMPKNAFLHHTTMMERNKGNYKENLLCCGLGKSSRPSLFHKKYKGKIQSEVEMLKGKKEDNFDKNFLTN